MNEPVFRMTLALPASLRPKIEAIAAAERRSISKQIVVLLESAVREVRPSGGQPAAEQELQT